jgi:pimeloyl-ACP methyl ester carboxylesterase
MNANTANTMIKECGCADSLSIEMVTILQHRLVQLGGLVAIVALLTQGAAAQVPSHRTRTSEWQPTDCITFKLRLESPTVKCGYVSVPRRHSSPAGPAIRLATVVIRSEAANRAPEPLFIAQGGPGGSSIESFAQMLISVPNTRPAANRDLVVWDQRGTLYSQPALMCPEVAKARLNSARDERSQPGGSDEAVELAAYRACGERLAREAGELSAFNTVDNANDVEALRVALGYGDIMFYGVSYGTELGQYLMRQHPTHLRAVVLDAVVPTSFNLITDVALVQQRIAVKYFESCAREPRCNAAFPNLASRFLALIDRLDKTPVSFRVASTKDPSDAMTVTMNGEDLYGALYQALYIRQAKPLIPYIVDRADKGDFSFVSGFLVPALLMEQQHADGMYMAVVCAEHGDADPQSVTRLTLLPRLVEATQRGAATMLAICRSWKIELLPRSVLEPVRSNIPTLLLSGEFDPVTPPAFAAQVASGLSRASSVIFPSGTHGQAFQSACANQIIRRFLDDPTTQLDASCAASAPSGFITPQDLIVIRPLRDAAAHATGGLLAYALRFVFLSFGLAMLATAIPVYAVVEVTAILRGRRDAVVASAAPWLPVLAFVLFSAALLALVGSFAITFATNELLTFLGAVPGSMRWVFALPLLGVMAVLLMAVAALAVWVSRRRTFLGRVYYLVLLAAALSVVAGLWNLGLLSALWS